MHVKARKAGKRGKSRIRLETHFEMDTLLTSHDVSELLQVDPSSITNWVRGGQLKSYKTPGGHNRIAASDLFEFLDGNKMAIPAPLRRLGQRRVLVVDDDPRELSRWRRLLREEERIELRLADNGFDALLQVGVFLPDLVVLDLVMPNLNGVELCRKLRVIPEMKGVGVVLVSASMTDEARTQAIDAGAQAAWSKPIAVEQIYPLLNLSDAKEPAIG